jgi:hypothetical protein
VSIRIRTTDHFKQRPIQKDEAMEGHVKSHHRYKGRNVTLIPSLEGYMWACQYVIEKSGKREMDGFPGNTYSSREEAELAALAKAKILIDQCRLDKDPLGT